MAELTRIEPRLPELIRQISGEFSHFHGTQDKLSVLQILVKICETFTEHDPAVREKLEEAAFTAVCAKLDIDHCILQAVRKQLKRCCKDKLACLPCLG